MFEMTEFEYIIRLMIASFCGALIGYERKNRSKVAGVRTHCVVACASALMMVLSKYAYLDVISMYGDFMKIDPSRIASGVVSGIGFLGAGMIFHVKKTVTGLTTAAGIWATSGIGMAIGAGMYWVGGSATLIILLIQIILHIIPKHKKFPFMQSFEENDSDTMSAASQQENSMNFQPVEKADELTQ